MASAIETPQPVLRVWHPRVLRPADYAVGIVAYAASFAVYLHTVDPVVYGEDCGELVSAAYTLGIPHPTGYPLWCILAKLFITLVHEGNVAWRANLMSAVFGSGTVMITAMIICVLVRNRLAALAGALSLAFSYELWEQSVIAEVYTLNSFITALCILLLIVWAQSRRNYLLYLCGLLYGVGLANHQVLLLCAPAFAVFVLSIAGLRWGAWTMHLLTLLLAFAGLAVYLYLPIRSAANPPMDWGNPETWTGFLDVVTRKQYQFIIIDGPRTWGRFGHQFVTFGGIYLQQFTIGVGLLAPFGVYVVWKMGHRAACIMLVIAWIVTALGCILIPNYGSDRLTIWLNTTYWIPAYVISAIFIGAAIAGVCAATPRLIVRATVALVLCVAAIGAPLVSNFTHNDKSRFYLASDYARNILTTLAPGAIYFGDSDLALFPVMYCQIVEHMRPDVLIANPYGYEPESVYHDMPAEVKSKFRAIPSDDDEQVIFEWLVKNSGRPVYSTAQRKIKGIHAQNAGLLYRYAPEGTPVPPDSPWGRYAWRTLDESKFEDDWSAEVVLYEYYFARGRMNFDQGKRADGLNSFERAAQIARENKEALNNLGSAAGDYGFLDEAQRYFNEACALDPTFDMARLNLGRVYMKRGDFSNAKEQFDRVLASSPNDATAKALADYCAKALAGTP